MLLPLSCIQQRHIVGANAAYALAHLRTGGNTNIVNVLTYVPHFNPSLGSAAAFDAKKQRWQMGLLSEVAQQNAVWCLQHRGCPYQIVLLQALQKSVPQDFELMGQRKGFVRYTSAPLQQLVKQHAEALQNKETALAGILQVPCCLSLEHTQSLLSSSLLPCCPLLSPC